MDYSTPTPIPQGLLPMVPDFIRVEFPSFCLEDIRSVDSAFELCETLIALVTRVITPLASQLSLCRLEFCQIMPVGAADVTDYRLIAHLAEPLEAKRVKAGVFCVHNQFSLTVLKHIAQQLALKFPSAAIDRPLSTKAFYGDEESFVLAVNESLPTKLA